MDRLSAIAKLRSKMKEVGIDVALIPTSDCHNSEYVAPYFKLREYLSGFTGSAGTLIVGESFASLYTDGRYFIQADLELKGSGIELKKQGTDGVPKLRDYLKEVCPEGRILFFDAELFTAEKGLELAEDHPGAVTTLDIRDIWPERPKLKFRPVFILDKNYSGRSTADKLSDIRGKMSEKGADVHIVSALDDIAWILNLRGNDIEYCPLFYSYLVIFKDEAYLYANIDDPDIIRYLDSNGVSLRPYQDFYNDIGQSTYIGTECNVLLDKKKISYRIYTEISGRGCKVINAHNPSGLMKAVKNRTEAENFRKAHITDAVAMIRFEKWLSESIARKDELTELSIAEHLTELRAKAPSYISDSFETICAYNSNAAIVHYSADTDSNAAVAAPGILLVDSGGHYLEGTTDITRTYLLGGNTALQNDTAKNHTAKNDTAKNDIEQRDAGSNANVPSWIKKFKHDYTLVAISMLRLMNCRFKKGTRGSTLDAIARQSLWNEGLDFDHGTGHGVGYLLNVHEGPNRISFRYSDPEDDVIFVPGMVTSDEPGVYAAGQYGIRIENLILCTEDQTTEYGQFLAFDPLTLVPVDLKAIDRSVMSADDIELLNRYHERVYKTISPYLDDEEREYLRNATSRI